VIAVIGRANPKFEDSNSHHDGGFFYFWRKPVSKEEAMAAIVACAKKLGRAPKLAELRKHTGLTKEWLAARFGSYRQALEACGLERKGIGKVEMGALFEDWAGIVRRLKQIPTRDEYAGLSKFSVKPLNRLFRSWSLVPEGMQKHAREHGLEKSWKDVMELVEQTAGKRLRPRRPAMMADQPVYGAPISGWPLMFAPTNEAGVLFLFGAMAMQLGFRALRIQAGYPDCEAMRVVGENRLQRVRIEIEHESRNFRRHAHKPSGCELIVCWEHNWAESPLEVVELKSAVERLGGMEVCAKCGNGRG